MNFNNIYNQIIEKFTFDKNNSKAKKDFKKGDLVGIAKHGDNITLLGNGIKKSETPNIKIIKDGENYFAIAISDIKKDDNLTASAISLSYRNDVEDSKKTVVMKLKPNSKHKFKLEV